MRAIEPKLFYATPSGDKDNFARIVVIEKDGDAGTIYYITRKQAINLLKLTLELLFHTI